MASRIGEGVDAKPILVRRNICRLYDLKNWLNYQIWSGDLNSWRISLESIDQNRFEVGYRFDRLY